LLSCQPSAVGAGGRHELRPHAEARRLVVAPPAGKAWTLGARVPFVHEAAGHRAGPGVHVLVVAPDREIGADVVQAQRQVADGMCQVEADHRAGGMAQARDFREVEGLPGAVLHARPDDGRQARPVLGDGAFDRRHRERPVFRVTCESSAYRSDGKAPASMRIAGRSRVGR
jgi:hypothetical protein